MVLNCILVGCPWIKQSDPETGSAWFLDLLISPGFFVKFVSFLKYIWICKFSFLRFLIPDRGIYSFFALTRLFFTWMFILLVSSLSLLFVLCDLHFLLSEWCQKITNRILSVFWRENLPVHLGLRHFFLSSYIFSIWKPNFEQKYFKYGKKKL